MINLTEREKILCKFVIAKMKKAKKSENKT
jgi:hypothetical protein